MHSFNISEESSLFAFHISLETFPSLFRRDRWIQQNWFLQYALGSQKVLLGGNRCHLTDTVFHRSASVYIASLASQYKVNYNQICLVQHKLTIGEISYFQLANHRSNCRSTKEKQKCNFTVFLLNYLKRQMWLRDTNNFAARRLCTLSLYFAKSLGK